MLSSVMPSAAQQLLPEPDWVSLGLVASVVGCFLIANAILFEHPRRLVERHFAKGIPGRLRSIREYIYNRVQTTLGFTFLMGGFGLQLAGRYRPAPLEAPPLSVSWVGVLVLVAVALLVIAWWWSLWAFRRYVREYFALHPEELDGDPATARELGELFGIEPFENDTVEAYTARLKGEVGLVQPFARRPAARTFPEPEDEVDVADVEEALGREGGTAS